MKNTSQVMTCRLVINEGTLVVQRCGVLISLMTVCCFLLFSTASAADRKVFDSVTMLLVKRGNGYKGRQFKLTNKSPGAMEFRSLALDDRPFDPVYFDLEKRTKDGSWKPLARGAGDDVLGFPFVLKAGSSIVFHGTLDVIGKLKDGNVVRVRTDAFAIDSKPIEKGNVCSEPFLWKGHIR